MSLKMIDYIVDENYIDIGNEMLRKVKVHMDIHDFLSILVYISIWKCAWRSQDVFLPNITFMYFML